MLGQGQPSARRSHMPHNGFHVDNRRMKQGPKITGPWQPRSSRFDRKVTAPNPAGISVTPNEIGGSSSSHIRVPNTI
ncbi:hypothetical protein Taro_043895 [Colocasia esculenta]|uniref:Uncharacterized protein n=1 Tax=Colocasia esculenta TaxID=4460 RepID=A0A843WWX3_COLES|nr:hypothetical protein [Colocasia esculenta]